LSLRESTRRKILAKERERERERDDAQSAPLYARNEGTNAPVVENARADGNSSLTESRRRIPTRAARFSTLCEAGDFKHRQQSARTRRLLHIHISSPFSVFHAERACDGSGGTIAEMSEINGEKSINFQSLRDNQPRIRARFLTKLALYAEHD